MNILKNQKGFAVLEILLIVVVVGALGAIGFRAYQARHKVAAPAEKKAEAPKVDPTAKWTKFVSAKGEFSLRYPPTWVQPDHREFCNADLFERDVYLGPNQASVLHCASEFFGQMWVQSIEEDKVTQLKLAAREFDSIQESKVTVNGVVGTRESGISNGIDADAGPGAMPKNVKVVQYLFFANGNTYRAWYEQYLDTGKDAPDGPSVNVLSDFDLMVKSTLKFTK